MPILALDLGTTNCKAGVISKEGEVLSLASRPVRPGYRRGLTFLQAERFWENVCQAVAEAVGQDAAKIDVIAIASMAETGLLIDRRSGRPLSDMLPWYSRHGQEQVEQINAVVTAQQRFPVSGIRPSFKCGLAKILWLRQNGADLRRAVWLSAADYIAFRLTNDWATDYTLAARTYCLDIQAAQWDEEWLSLFGLNKDLFPPIRPSGQAMGLVSAQVARQLSVPAGVPVAICGHDHVVAAVAVGAVKPNFVFNSMGTAEVLVGATAIRRLGESEFRTGLSYGPHVRPGLMCWMGGISASGGSLEWLRSLLGDEKLSYAELMGILAKAPREPTRILYYPYLAGSGAPNPDPTAQAAFIGLTQEHGRADLVKAVLEGNSYEFESLRQAAEQVHRAPIRHIYSVGGGVRNRTWLQIKADVTNCRFVIPQVAEATLVGAALTAACGVGMLSWSEIKAITEGQPWQEVVPDPELHSLYSFVYHQGYQQLQPALRQHYQRMHGRHRDEQEADAT